MHDVHQRCHGKESIESSSYKAKLMNHDDDGLLITRDVSQSSASHSNIHNSPVQSPNTT